LKAKVGNFLFEHKLWGGNFNIIQRMKSLVSPFNDVQNET